MVDCLETILKNKKVHFEKLLIYGFEKIDTGYSYCKKINKDGFLLTVTVSLQGEVSAVVMDPADNEPYTLYLAAGATGSFVGNIRSQYEEILNDIADNCFEPDVFKTKTAKQLIAYIDQEYGDALEFLWTKFPNNAIWRRKDSGKWYAALLTVSKRKLGIASDEIVEIIDLRATPENLERLIDCQKYFPGYHMNKKHWYTMILDGTVPHAELCRKIQESYCLAGKN